MYTMKEVCGQVGIPYETLRFYCNEGLVPNVKRAQNNYRLFDERDITWLQGLQHLKRCGMSIQDMKTYMNLCLAGQATIPERQRMLAGQRAYLLNKLDEINRSIAFIDAKQGFYAGVIAGAIPYTSNLIHADD